MRYDTNIQNGGECPDCERYERQANRWHEAESALHGRIDSLHSEVAELEDRNALLKEENERLRGTIGVECVKQLSELKKALAELLRFESSIRYATTNALNEPDNFNKALDKVIELLQPKKDESHDEPIKER